MGCGGEEWEVVLVWMVDGWVGSLEREFWCCGGRTGCGGIILEERGGQVGWGV